MNIDMGANKRFLDDKFVGPNENFTMGAESDIASGKYRYKDAVREFGNLANSRFYVSPRFLDRVALHVVKNILADTEKGGVTENVPLILGVWGAKGQGKTFQLELACRTMGITPVVMSAGELEDEEAGLPGLIIRERYRAAANLMKRAGKLSALIINDLDAGVGRMGDNQYTVNNQMVMGTLMNLCDHPERVSVGDDWVDHDTVPRTPIIITGNDFSTLYAPLVRDGRMEKFYWKPDRSDMLGAINVLFQGDGYTDEELENLYEAFPKKSMDFFGALRARTFDDKIREWTLERCGGEAVKWDSEVDMSWLHSLVKDKESLPVFDPPPPDLERLIGIGRDLDEQARLVEEQNLAMDYFKNLEFELEPEELAARKEAEEEERRRRAMAEDAMRFEHFAKLPDGAIEEELAAATGKAMEEMRRMEEEAERTAALAAEAAAAANVWNHPWPRAIPEEAHARVFEEGHVWVDLRTSKEFRREPLKDSVSVPCVVFTGATMLDWATDPVPLGAFRDALIDAFPNPAETRVVAIPPTGDSATAEGALAVMHELGFESLAQLTSFEDYTFEYTPKGVKRPPVGDYKHVAGASGTICVGSELPVVNKESVRTLHA